MMQIVFTGDILRPTETLVSSQNLNIKWFYHLLYWQLKKSSQKLDIQCLLWEEDNTSFNACYFYQLNKMDVSIENWAILFNAEVFSPDAEAYLLEFFKSSLIIGFELPTSFKIFFNRHNITYIDFYIDPIRFLDDIFFSVNSNDHNINKVLKNYELDESLIYIQAGIHQATISRIHNNLDIHEDACLIVGQTRIDRSLIQNDKILSIFDFHDKLLEIKNLYSNVYFKPHPYDYNNNDLVQYLKEMNFTIIDENIYVLLMHPNIKTVYAISSSVVEESNYFNKSAEYLKKILPNNYIKIYNSYLSYEFWSNLFHKNTDIKPVSPTLIGMGKNRLRNSLGQYWGYPKLSDEILYHEIARNEIEIALEYKRLKESGVIQFFKPLLKKILKLK